MATTMVDKLGEVRFKPGTKDRIAMYANAYGTILFWDDMAAVAEMNESAPEIYKDKGQDWTHQSNGMHQYHLWCALEALGLGVNVQHYNPLIDEDVKVMWSVPQEWKLRAQMVFGTPQEGALPGEKVQIVAMEKRQGVFGAARGCNGER